MLDLVFVRANDRTDVTTRKVKVKHFREFKGKMPYPKGGYTALFDLSSGNIYVSKCRPDESFSKRKGVYTCIQKMIESGLPFPEPKKVDFICDIITRPNAIELLVAKEDYRSAFFDKYESHYWWL